MEPEDTNAPRTGHHVPWLAVMAGIGAASLFSYSLAGLCAISTRQACTVGFTVGPVAPLPPLAAERVPQAEAPRLPATGTRTVANGPDNSTGASGPPPATGDIPFVPGNPETANPAYVALVIGNASYGVQTPLKNPVNDARAIADSLRRQNYTLVGGGPQIDLDRKQFFETLDTFRQLARNARVAIVYYAGHGIQIDDKEPIYLIPVDATLAYKRDLESEAIELKRLQAALPAGRTPDGEEQYGVLILDACRISNFPLEGVEPAKRGTGQRGLKAVAAKDRSFIAFSASAGEPASDGEGVNSPYAQALLSAMQPRERQLPDIKDVFSRVDETFKSNGQLQDPEKSDKLGDRKIILKAPQRPRPVGWVGRDCPQCPEIKILAPGKFMIGSPPTESTFEDERPQTEIEFRKPFAIGITEVTFAEFDACVAEGFCTTKPDDEKWGRQAFPVINVTWQDAQQFAQWLKVRTGNPYRLLSEAEWEYAARAGTTTAYPWGPEARRDRANYGGIWPDGKDRVDGENGKSEGADRWLHTAPVRSFPANPWGLHDMHGNVSEWVEDCYPKIEEGLWGRPYRDMPRDGSAFKPATCKQNVYGLRGGSWDSQASEIRSALRNGNSTSQSYIGFRIARDN